MLFPTLILSLFAMIPLQAVGSTDQIVKAVDLTKSKAEVVATPPAKVATPAKKDKASRPVQVPVALKIGVVDWERVRAGSRWIRALERSAQRELMPHKTKLDALGARRTELREVLSLYKPGTADYAEKLSELSIVEYSIKQKQTLVKGFMGMKLQEMTFQFNKAITDKIASYARENGFHLVLRKNSPSTLKNVPMGSKVEEQERNSVLYFAPSIDITKQVLERLDANVPDEASSNKPDPAGKAPSGTGSGKNPPRASGGKDSNR